MTRFTVDAFGSRPCSRMTFARKSRYEGVAASIVTP
jgi:hypothetical protein